MNFHLPSDRTPGAVARERLLSGRGEPFLHAAWERALMVHYAVDPEVLQPLVPYALDLRDGQAWVSLVAFTMRGMAPRRGGRWTAWLLQPIATHEFLNVRTYVTDGSEPGIFFLQEWLPNRLAVALGRPAFGLPYCLGDLSYNHRHETGTLFGSVVDAAGAGQFSYTASVTGGFFACVRGSLTEFLMERYSAFTCWQGWRRRFRIWHPPWPQTTAEVQVTDDSLLRKHCPWYSAASPAGAHYSPGFPEVWMGRPVTL
jgi:hypothetical protein